MFLLQKSNQKTSSRQQIAIQGVRQEVLILSHSRYRMILRVSSLNFELKSEDEQDAIIDTYESFLNSVGCPLQILIRAREIDLDKYLDELNERLSSETEDVYRAQLVSYDCFVRNLTTNNKILTRHFYVIVPYDTSSKVDFDSAREQLALRVDIVMKGLSKLGIQSWELSNLEVLDLFYSFYNPEQAKIQPLTEQALELIHTSFIQTEQAL